MNWRASTNWVTIECYDAAAHALRAPEEIHKEILAAIEARVLLRARTPSR